MRDIRISRFGLAGLLLLAALASGCDGQNSDSGSASASAGNSSVPQSVCATARMERAGRTLSPIMLCGPVISGTPATTVMVDSAFNFQPTVSGSDEPTLAFSIENKPSWANFDATTGALTGTPSAADVGSYTNILITVTNGVAIASLPAFSLTVAQTASGSVTLSWVAPETNTNGTPVTNLAGYRIYYGTSSTALTQSVTVAGPGMTNYVIDNLAPGTWYFSIASYNSNGVDSIPTAIVSVTI